MNTRIGALAAFVAIATVGLVVTLMASGVLVSSQTIQMSGVIASANLGVYSDNACTQSLTSINWGTLEPGGSVARTIYVKNIGTVPLTLNLAVSNWAPTTSNTYLTVTWNHENYALGVGNSVSVIITMTASASAGSLTTFSVDIVVTGTG